jgi:23S rRNA (uracil1939-C5)-methyltransferase
MNGEKIITIDRLAFGGEGVGRSEGKVIFVPWTAPGDRVRVRVVSDHGRYERGEVVEILEPSPDRVEPPCPVFGRCGGCQWQHLKYETQLRMKEEIFKETLIRTGQIADPKIFPMVPAPDPWHYRSRIQLRVDGEGRIGFHAFKSHEVVPCDDCRIADPRLNAKLAEIRASAERPTGPFELSLNGNGMLRTGVSSEEKVFSQVHPEQNKRLIQAVLDFAFGNAEIAFTRKKTVVELYAGSGNFTFPIADRAGMVFAIEENPKAVAQGIERTEANGFSNIEWIGGTAEWGLKKLYRRKTMVDMLVLDPPRRGAKEILDLIPVIRPRLVVYVSCDPVTLARDLNLLVRRHYRLEKVLPVDMFPQTYHIESVAQLVLA